MVNDFFHKHDMNFDYQGNMSHSPKTLLSSESGIYLVCLKIWLPPKGEDFDKHCMVYDANLNHLYDNRQSLDIPEVKPTDMTNNIKAIKVFKHYFGLATYIDIHAVYKVSLRFPKTLEPTDIAPTLAGAKRKDFDGKADDDDGDKKPAWSPRKRFEQILAARIDRQNNA